MLRSMLHGGAVLAASFCSVLFASCGLTPLYYSPVDEKSPAEIFAADVSASMLKTGTFTNSDGDVTITFSEYKDGSKNDDAASKKDFEKNAVRGLVNIANKDDKDDSPAETWLPVLLVPFRHADSLFFYLAIDQMYIMEKCNLNPEYVFMTRPYSYLMKAEAKDGGWEIGFVQFATTGLEVKKVSDRAQIDKDGTVFNPPGELLDMLKDPKNYEVTSKMLFSPAKSGK